MSASLAIHRPGVALLHRWGRLDRLVATGCPPITRMRWHLQDIELVGDLQEHEGGRAMCAPRRHIPDEVLVRACALAGRGDQKAVICPLGARSGASSPRVRPSSRV